MNNERTQKICDLLIKEATIEKTWNCKSDGSMSCVASRTYNERSYLEGNLYQYGTEEEVKAVCDFKIKLIKAVLNNQ